MHFNARDLAAFFNKIVLISITQNKPIVDMDTTRLAFHQQASSFTHMALLAFFFIFIFSTLDLLCKLSWFLSKYAFIVHIKICPIQFSYITRLPNSIHTISNKKCSILW